MTNHGNRRTPATRTHSGPDDFEHKLPHERLDVFRVAIELVEFVYALELPRGHSHNHDQLKRAASSVANNVAEGCGKTSRDRVRFYTIARASALESAASLRVLLAAGAINEAKYVEGRTLCARLYAMLTRMCGF